MMSKRVINTAALMQPIAHFSHAVRVGNLIYIGATAGTDSARRLAGQSPGLIDADAQIRQMFDNLDTALGLLGGRREKLVRLKTYVTDMRDLTRYENIYRERFGQHLPAHAVVGSAGFPLPQAATELDAVALADTEIQRLSHSSVQAGSRHYCTALPLDAGGRAVGGDMRAQSRAALAQLSAMLSTAGLTPSEVVNLHVTLGDLRDFPAFENEFRRTFRAPYPSRTVVAALLPQPRMRVQIEAVAQKGGGRPIGSVDARLGCASTAMLVGQELFLSGQLGLDAGGRLAEGVEAQTRAAWLRIEQALGEAGMGKDHVLRTNNILTDWRDYREYNNGYGANVAPPYPPRTTVIARLLDPSASVQIEAVAHADASDAVVLDTAADAAHR